MWACCDVLCILNTSMGLSFLISKMEVLIQILPHPTISRIPPYLTWDLSPQDPQAPPSEDAECRIPTLTSVLLVFTMAQSLL